MEIRRASVIALLAAISIAIASACTSQESATEQVAVPEVSPTQVTPIVITNDQVKYPIPGGEPWSDESAQRIVTLANGSGEIVAALGAADRVVGRDETSNSPAIEGAPVVTDGHAVSAEQVIALEPDVVLIDADTSPPEALNQIRDAGIHVVEVPQAWSPDEVGAKTQAIGDAIGAPLNSIMYVSDLSAASTKELPAVGNRVAFLYLRGTSAIYLLGGVGSGADALIADSGAVDVGAEAGLEAFTPLTAEEIVNLNPDTILVMSKGLDSVGGIEGLVQLPGVAQTDAGKSKRIVAVDDTLLLSFGPRTGTLIGALNDAWQQLGS